MSRKASKTILDISAEKVVREIEGLKKRRSEVIEKISEEDEKLSKRIEKERERSRQRIGKQLKERDELDSLLKEKINWLISTERLTGKEYASEEFRNLFRAAGQQAPKIIGIKTVPKLIAALLESDREASFSSEEIIRYIAANNEHYSEIYVRQSLVRLAKEGRIERASRGKYKFLRPAPVPVTQ